MADNNDNSSVTDLYNAFVHKKFSEVRRLCLAHPEFVLQKISIYNDTALHMAARSKQKGLLLDLLRTLDTVETKGTQPEIHEEATSIVDTKHDGAPEEQVINSPVTNLPKDTDSNQKLSDIKNKNGNTILHEMATSDAMIDAAEELLKRHVELLTASNDLGEKPIFCAARYGQSQMFKFLAAKMELKNLSPEEIKPNLQREDGTTVLHVSIATESFGLGCFIAYSYPFLIKERDRNSMTALQSLACNASAFVTPTLKEGKFMDDIMYPKRKSEWLADYSINRESYLKKSNDRIQVVRNIITMMSRTIELISFDCLLFGGYKKFPERSALYHLVKLLVKIDTLWNDSSKATSTDASSQEMGLGESNKESHKMKGRRDSHENLTTNHKKSNESPLLLATMSNIKEIVMAALIYQPEALNHTNEEGMNILHVAILYRHIDIFDIVVKHEVFSKWLLSATDNKGNSILHMVSQKRKSQASEKVQNPAVQLQDELLLFEKVKSASKMLVNDALNKDNKTAEELFAATNEQLHKDAKEWLMRTTENCTILSVFIATVAFAAAYTVPGGPNQDTGIPLLRSTPFFEVFIVADVISLTLALTSVGIFFSILTSSFPLHDFKTYLFQKLKLGVICLVVSVTMMAVAFGATIALAMTENRKNVIVWDLVAFLPVPIFFLSCSPLRSLILRPCRELFTTFVVILVCFVFIVALLLIFICASWVDFAYTIGRIVLEPLRLTVEKASESIRWICGKQVQSDTQSPQPRTSTAPLPTQV